MGGEVSLTRLWRQRPDAAKTPPCRRTAAPRNAAEFGVDRPLEAAGPVSALDLDRASSRLDLFERAAGYPEATRS
jgi:hypothetical protein